MNALFASGDVGGARALLPIIERCFNEGIKAIHVDNGHISKEAPSYWPRISPEALRSKELLENFLLKNNIRVFIFASSLIDTIALSLARRIKKLHIPVIHVLDNWTSYRNRMETDSLPVFVPDHYAVMDDMAYKAAAEDGIEESTLMITGQPALANLANEFIQWKATANRSLLRKYGFVPDKKLIIFISEPVEQDQGASIDCLNYRGYTEKVVLRIFCETMQFFADKVQIAILPHPREDAVSLEKLWNNNKGKLSGQILHLNKGREGVFISDGVAGMGSILMYEAWLIGKPLISLQPGLRIQSLRMLQNRENVNFVDSYDNVSELLTNWTIDIIEGVSRSIRPELAVHEKALVTLCDLIKSISINKKNI